MPCKIDTLGKITRLLTGLMAEPPCVAALATVDAAGGSRVRMVVVRALALPQLEITISSDSRSDKIPQLIRSPFAEVCIWAEDQRIAVRLLAQWTIISGSQRAPQVARDLQAFWEAHSPRSRSIFAGAQPGGGYRPPRRRTPVRGSIESYPMNFAMLCGRILEIDAVELHRDGQLRWHYFRRVGNAWDKRRINP